MYRLLTIIVFLSILAHTMGCASTFLEGAEDVPEGSGLIRCTEYTGNTGGMFTGSSIQGDGCQCLFVNGDSLPADMRIDLQTCGFGTSE